MDVERAELCVACYVQRSTYGTIYRELSADAERYQQTISKVTNVQLKRELKSLSALCPFLDSLGLLRVHGRLSKLDINFNRQHQIMLLKRYHFMNLVVQHHHEKQVTRALRPRWGLQFKSIGLYRVLIP